MQPWSPSVENDLRHLLNEWDSIGGGAAGPGEWPAHFVAFFGRGAAEERGTGWGVADHLRLLDDQPLPRQRTGTSQHLLRVVIRMPLPD
ncbi:hypothetical protein [Streptomyces bobili]|uniref:hypothetical protein n=1 Tax=Streptomyces bobili TaxID=67280 RepID=UPI003722571D